MHEPFKKAVRDDPGLAHAAVVHDQFHITKRAGEAVTELRRAVFFRAGPELRAIGKGTRWLVLRSWERSSEEQRDQLRTLFRLNGKLGRAYQLVEELRAVLRAPDRATLTTVRPHPARNERAIMSHAQRRFFNSNSTRLSH